jgi:hypothetical protein
VPAVLPSIPKVGPGAMFTMLAWLRIRGRNATGVVLHQLLTGCLRADKTIKNFSSERVLPD